ncbi:MAG TPA: kelch repeat-containing protein [Bacteroidales bacterium]|nr:kelch repeat-containing protein [Bacteroidales bacterium]
MKKLPFIISLLFAASFIISCTDDDSDSDLIGNWTKSSDFEGIARNGAVSFVINNKAYVGTGYNGKKALSDFWRFDSETQSWTQVASLKDQDNIEHPRYTAAAFAIGDKGYVGTGENDDVYLSDFWEYDSNTNAWSKKPDFAGSARKGAIGFSIGSKGYIATGFDDNYLKDIWEYDPATSTWSQKPSLGGTKRVSAQVFVIDDKAYIVGGNNNGSLVYDFWRFDPSQENPWTSLRKINNSNSDESYDDEYTTIARYSGVAFTSADKKGYITTGYSGSLSNTVWEYDPSTDLWKEKTSFEGSTRFEAVGFTINNRMFITTGSYGDQLDDTWEFKPAEEYDENN